MTIHSGKIVTFARAVPALPYTVGTYLAGATVCTCDGRPSSVSPIFGTAALPELVSLSIFLPRATCLTFPALLFLF